MLLNFKAKTRQTGRKKRLRVRESHFHLFISSFFRCSFLPLYASANAHTAANSRPLFPYLGVTKSIWTPVSEPDLVSVCSSVPGSPPRKLEAEPVNSTAIRVTWKPPLSGKQHGQIRGYQVIYSRLENGEPRGQPSIMDVALPEAQVTPSPYMYFIYLMLWYFRPPAGGNIWPCCLFFLQELHFSF